MEKKQGYELNKLYKKWVGKKVVCRASEYAAALSPSIALLAINYDEWVAQASNKTSIGMGFSMLIVSTIISLLEVSKSDSDFMKKFPKLVYGAFTLTLWAATFALLASIMNELASMFFYVAIGIWGAAIAEGVEKAYINPKLALIKSERDKVGLSSTGAFEAEVKRAATSDSPKRAKELNEILNQKASRK